MEPENAAEGAVPVVERADGAEEEPRGAAITAGKQEEGATKHAETKPGHNPPAVNPAKKRKVAMFLAYVGHGYQGMQRNPGARTIEDELFRALHVAGAISDANNDDHGFMKIHWMRAARTDKGVSAVGQVVSLKMVLEPPGMLDRINAALPEQIRVFGFSRATNGFDSRKHCDKRRYEYILPEWAFDPRQSQGRVQRAATVAAAAAGAEDAQRQGQQQGGERAGAAAGADADAAAAAATATGMDVGGSPVQAAGGEEGQPAAAAAAATGGEADAAGEAAPETAPAGPEAGEAAEPGAAFAFDEAAAQRLSSILSQYEGTHNFHNYTVRKPASAPDAKRYILSFRCPGVIEISGERWVKMVVVGQSFMLHQIRKMVGMAVAVMRGVAPEPCLRLALKSGADLNTPMAPELGLFLDECFFEAYSDQWGELHSRLTLADFQTQADAFKVDRLYPHIVARDGQEGVNAGWVKTLNEANYRFSHWEQEAGLVRQGGGRRPPPKGAGAAAVVGGMESYGQHKRPSSGGGGRGGGANKRQRGGTFGGRTGRVLPPPHLRGGAPAGEGGAAAQQAAGELSD